MRLFKSERERERTGTRPIAASDSLAARIYRGNYEEARAQVMRGHKVLGKSLVQWLCGTWGRGLCGWIFRVYQLIERDKKAPVAEHRV